jgi:hypothetical protein
VFCDPRALDPDGPLGVADDEAVFVTSANLTEPPLDRTIELGVLIRDRALRSRAGEKRSRIPGDVFGAGGRAVAIQINLSPVLPYPL